MKVKLTGHVKENILVTNSVIDKFNEKRTRLQLSINNVFNYLEISITILSFQLEDLINATMFSSLNKLHPSVITPIQLHKELINSFRHLPQDLELPVPLEIDMIHIITDISKVSSYYTKNRLMFVLQIPLVFDKEYKLYHNIPLPTPHNLENPNTFSLKIPNAKYIALTIDKIKINYFDLDSLENCLVINYKHYICNVANVYATDTKATCESELLSKVVNKIPNQCEAKLIYGKVDIWKQLNYNRWIFVQNELSRLTIECSALKLHQENMLLGTGILNLSESCIGYNKNTILKSKINKNLPLPTVTFDFNLINDSCCNTNRLEGMKNSVSPIKLEKIDLDNLKPQKDLLMKKLLNTKLEEEIPHIIRYWTHYSIITIITLLIIVCGRIPTERIEDMLTRGRRVSYSTGSIYLNLAIYRPRRPRSQRPHEQLTPKSKRPGHPLTPHSRISCGKNGARVYRPSNTTQWEGLKNLKYDLIKVLQTNLQHKQLATATLRRQLEVDKETTWIYIPANEILLQRSNDSKDIERDKTRDRRDDQTTSRCWPRCSYP
ncbi:uncharacterized protein LOC120636518 [Pararge aegeria]|uniref:uncharacterized protein LOC120636518 n=1 Tax=Pararge aegeria TaxID=116150 RepID=UPI0019D07652|nr:uncharacterized protein LOC120636518 [Pararge aegeria]